MGKSVANAIVPGADITFSLIDIADQPTTFEIVCACARVSCFAAIVVLLYRPGSQTFFDELTPVLEHVKFDVAFIDRIISYHDILCDIVSYWLNYTYLISIAIIYIV